jgi:hypothetical protein
MSETIYNSKYEAGLDIAEIAKRLRREIKAAVKVGELPKCKYSVRISRYSMGQSLHVTITETPFPVHNRLYLELEHEILYGNHDRAEINELYAKRDETQQWTQGAIDLIPKVEAMANQWNYDGSDSQTDYYYVNYSMNVDYDAHDEWVEMTEAIKQSLLQERPL